MAYTCSDCLQRDVCPDTHAGEDGYGCRHWEWRYDGFFPKDYADEEEDYSDNDNEDFYDYEDYE